MSGWNDLAPARRTERARPLHDADLELVRATLEGRPEAVARFVERMQCVPGIVSALNARLEVPLGADDVADVVQNSLVAVWRKLGDYASRAALETWVYRFCMLELLTGVRKRSRHPLPGSDEADAAPPDRVESSPADCERLHRGLTEVGPPEADVIRLKHFDELTFEEIGAHLGISPNTAKTQYYRGMTQLREVLAERMRRVREEAR